MQADNSSDDSLDTSAVMVIEGSDIEGHDPSPPWPAAGSVGSTIAHPQATPNVASFPHASSASLAANWPSSASSSYTSSHSFVPGAGGGGTAYSASPSPFPPTVGAEASSVGSGHLYASPSASFVPRPNSFEPSSVSSSYRSAVSLPGSAMAQNTSAPSFVTPSTSYLERSRSYSHWPPTSHRSSVTSLVGEPYQTAPPAQQSLAQAQLAQSQLGQSQFAPQSLRQTMSAPPGQMPLGQMPPVQIPQAQVPMSSERKDSLPSIIVPPFPSGSQQKRSLLSSMIAQSRSQSPLRRLSSSESGPYSRPPSRPGSRQDTRYAVPMGDYGPSSPTLEARSVVASPTASDGGSGFFIYHPMPSRAVATTDISTTSVSTATYDMRRRESAASTGSASATPTPQSPPSPRAQQPQMRVPQWRPSIASSRIPSTSAIAGSRASSVSAMPPHTGSVGTPLVSSVAASIPGSVSGSIAGSVSGSVAGSIAGSLGSVSRLATPWSSSPPNDSLQNLHFEPEILPGLVRPQRNLTFEFENCDVTDMLDMITVALSEMVEANDARYPPDNGGRPLDTPPTFNDEGEALKDLIVGFHGCNIPGITLNAYLNRILKYCPTTAEVFLAILVYLDRVRAKADRLKRHGTTHHLFALDSYNVHRFIIAGVTVASKFFSDIFYKNSRYAKVGGLPVDELNHLELQFLLLTDFRLMVPKEELQRYADFLVNYRAEKKAANAAANAPSAAVPVAAPTAA